MQRPSRQTGSGRRQVSRRRIFLGLLILLLPSLPVGAWTRPVPRIELMEREQLAEPVEREGFGLFVAGSLVVKPDRGLLEGTVPEPGPSTAVLTLESAVLALEGNHSDLDPGTSIPSLDMMVEGVCREDGRSYTTRLGWTTEDGRPRYEAALTLDRPGTYDFTLEAMPDATRTSSLTSPPVLHIAFTVDFTIPAEALTAAREEHAARGVPGVLDSAPVADDMTVLLNWDTRTGYSAGCGYQDASGKYAIIGANDGTQIVEVTNPASPHEWGFIPGNPSTWRECKTYGVRAYVTTEAAGSGLQIINLSNPHAPFLESTYNATFLTAHTVFINTDTGFMYVNGTRGVDEGMQIFDLKIDPVNLVRVGLFTTRYVHDTYEAFDPRHGSYRLYLSEIQNGLLEIYDDTNKSNLIPINSWTTPGAFTHNSSVNADHTIIMTTDESNPRGSGTIYDITDQANEAQLATFRSGGPETVIHNVHFDDQDPELIWVAHYTEGIRLVDLHRPSAPADVAHYDTFPSVGGGYQACWDVWPYDRDGWVYAFDTMGGLFVLRHDPTGSLLSGVVRDATSSLPIQGAQVVSPDTGQTTTAASALGTYALKVPYGTHLVRASGYGHSSRLVSVTMAPGVRNDMDISLTALPVGTVSGFVRRSDNSQGLSGATVAIVGTTVSTTTAADGSFTLSSVPEGTHQLDASLASYSSSRTRTTVPAGGTATLNILLDPAVFADDAETNKGWTFVTTGDTTVTSGRWLRTNPNGTYVGTIPVQPEDDHSPPPGVACFVTGNCPANQSQNPEACDVDNGVTTLTSPTFDAAAAQAATLEYWMWFSNDLGFLPGGPFTAQVSNNNGSSWVNLESIPSSVNPWIRRLFDLGSVVPLTSTMRVRFRVDSGSTNPSANVTEGAVDDVQVLKACQTPFYEIVATDTDSDGLVNACDVCASDPLNDADGDGVCGNTDKSPFVSDPAQSDTDADGVGNAADNCASTANSDQADNDGDGTGNVCDTDDDNDGTQDASDTDDDNDGVADGVDNCPGLGNRGQQDHGSDGVGDECDPDDGLITGVRFRTPTSLVWDKETGSSSYSVYRGNLGDALLVRVAGCFVSGLVTPFASDPDLPLRGEGSFYLVTRKDGSGTESSPGYGSNGVERTILTHCP